MSSKLPRYLKVLFQDEKNLYLLQEYIPGGDLEAYLERAGNLDESTSKFIICELMLAISFIHGCGYVHR